MSSFLNSRETVFLYTALVGVGCETPQSKGDAGTAVPFDSAARPDTYDSTDINTLTHEETNSFGATPPVAVRRVFANGGAPCALMQSGELYCWGFNLYRTRSVPARDWIRPRRVQGLRGIVQYAQSWAAACGIDHESHVWCLGYNYLGVLGTENAMEFLASAERRADIDNIEEVAMVANSMIGRRMDGVLYGRSPEPQSIVRISLPAAAMSVQGGGGGYCVTLSGGEIACDDLISNSSLRPPGVVAGLRDVASVAIGYKFFCALRRDGTVWCWGRNTVGQTGTPPERAEVCVEPDQSGGIHRTYGCVPRPQQVVGLTDVVEVSADGGLVCALRQDGTVWCWGDNPTPRFAAVPDRGTVGDGLPNTELCPQSSWIPMDQTPPPIPCRRRPSQVAGLTDVRQISVGGGVVCVLRVSGEIWCWGDNFTGDLGDGTTTSRAYSAPVLWPVATRDE